MAVCSWCESEMTDNTVDSCDANKSINFQVGGVVDSIPYHNDDPEGRCHDCNVKSGGYHHPGCDMERCPKCGGQLISCGCLEVEDD